MKKVLINPQPLICAPPTVLVGTMVNSKPNFMTVAWCGVANSNPPMISVAIRPARYTLKGIKNKEFSVNIPSVDIVKEDNLIVRSLVSNTAFLGVFRLLSVICI